MVPAPEDCELEEDRFLRMSKDANLRADIKGFLEVFAEERRRSPIAVKMAKEHDVTNNDVRYMYWMQAKNLPKYEAPFQKCILSYLSDLYFIGTISRIIGLKRHSKGPNAVAMTSTIDHSLWFYSDSFDCGDWLLYVMTCPRAGSGRGVMHGQIYSRDGTLVAIASQEGVTRADVRAPEETKAKL
ncbi:acyl-CoA thioesterase [Marasmius crinis-equi]|uniref:Acyl-CoA thioesterase n=1 Tax=Marasmius crinis-equi TaxID=585013 RepID=A0ABR3FWA6_9AGAR